MGTRHLPTPPVSVLIALAFALEVTGCSCGEPHGDAGIDAGADPAIDAGNDAGNDAGLDGGIDAGVDAGFDGGYDAGSDAGWDGGVDAGPPAPLEPCPLGPPVDLCGSVVTDLESDPANCGTCGNACLDAGACGLGLCWAPGDPARCSSAPRMAGTWTEIGPLMTGRISAIAPGADLAHVMVGTPGGGLWTTDDGGTSWSHSASDELADNNVLRLVYDRRDPARLYALTTSDLYASQDYGHSWTNLTRTGGHPRPAVSSLQTDPMPFAQLDPPSGGSVLLWGHPGSGLSWSVDSGATVHTMMPLAGDAANPDNSVAAIAADDLTGMIYLATGGPDPWTPHLYRSTVPWTAAGPGGNPSWVAIVNGIPDSRRSLIAWAGEAGRLVAFTEVGDLKAYTSTDGGDHWVATTSPIKWSLRPVLIPEPSRILVGGTLGNESLDFGATWSTFYVQSHPYYSHPDFRSLELQTVGTERWLWAGADGATDIDYSLYVALQRFSYASGVPLSNPVAVPTTGVEGVRTWQAYYATPTSGGTLLIGSQDNNEACTGDFGATWGYAGPHDLPPGMSGCGDYFSLTVAPSRPSRAYAMTCAADYLLRSDSLDRPCGEIVFSGIPTAGQVFYSATPWSTHVLTVDPRNADHLAIARIFDVAVSSNAGASVTTHPLPSGRPTAVLYDGQGRLYAGTGTSGVFVSADDGATFQPLGLGNPAPGEVRALAWSAAGGGNGTLFAGTTDGLYRHAPGGAFERVLGGGGYIVSEVTVDPNCATRIYAGFGFDWRSPHRGGVALSTDGGLTWSSLSAGTEVHKTPVTTIRVDPNDPARLFVGTYGRGAWTYSFGGAPPACL